MNSVFELITNNVQKMPLQKKIKIKELGRPLPDLTLKQVSKHTTENRLFTRHFSRTIYTSNDWICGCNITNKLYCFPCLLFYNPSEGRDSKWARTGIEDLQHIKRKSTKHEASVAHINACVEFAFLGKTNIKSHLSSTYRQQITEHNEMVEKNRYILKRIISCIKFCSAFELALRSRDETEQSENGGVFRELVDFSAELDATLKEHLKNATVFKDSTIQNDLLDSMLAVCKEEIVNEIKCSDFLAVQCDETTDVTNWCQMVLIFRYVYDGSVCEYFWCFKKLIDKSPLGIQNAIEEELDPIIKETPQKLIAQTYDGANLMSSAVGDIQRNIRNTYPSAHYIHCYAHHLNLLVQKAASHNVKVRVFFNNLSAIPAFFSNASNRCDVLEEIMKRKLPGVVVARSNYNVKTVNYVYENRKILEEVFEEIEEKCLLNTISHEASGIRRALQDPEFMFWLEFFHKLMPHVDTLYKQTQAKHKDNVELQADIQYFEKVIGDIKGDTDDIQIKVEEDYHTETKRKKENEDASKSVCAKEVCDVIVSQMKDRFSYRGHIQADSLFDTHSFQKYLKRFPVDILGKVCSAYTFLCKFRLRNELEVIYSQDDFKDIIGSINFFTFILRNNLDQVFSETMKLLQIVLTTPMATAEPERCFLTLKRIKTFLRNTRGNDRLNALAMLSINKKFVQSIEHFEDKVIDKFSAMENRADFNFKKL